MRAFGLIIGGLLLALPSSMAGQTPGDAEAAIRAGSQAWAAAFNAEDAAALAALYTADVVFTCWAFAPRHSGFRCRFG